MDLTLVTKAMMPTSKVTMAAYHCSCQCPNVPRCNTGSAVIGCKMRQITVRGAVNVTVGGPGRWTVAAGGTVTVTART
jgi:hypothetical protein